MAIKEIKSLDLFYQKYGQEFINRYNQNVRYFVIESKSHVITGHFALYENAHYPQTLFLGLYKITSFEPSDTNEFIKIINSFAKKEVVGPIDFAIWYSNRLKTEGDDYQYFWEPSAARADIDFLKMACFTTDKRYTTYFFDDLNPLKNYFNKSYEEAIASGYYFTSIEKEWSIDVDQLVKEVYELNTHSFSESHYYYPISLADYKEFTFLSLGKLDLSLSFSMRNAGGEMVGYVFTINDKNDRGSIGILKSIVLSPHYQGKSLSGGLVYATLQATLNRNITKGAGALLREGAKSEYIFKKAASDLSMCHTYDLFRYEVRHESC